MFARSGACAIRERSALFSWLGSDLKVIVLSLALCDLSLKDLLLDFRLLLCNIFIQDHAGLNNCIYAVSNRSLRSLEDLTHASSGLTRLVKCRSLGLGFASAHLEHLCTRHHDHLLQCFRDTGVSLEWDRDGFSPPEFANDPPARIALYAGPRGKSHSMSEVHAGMLTCYDLARDVFDPLCVDKRVVRKTRLTGHLAKLHIEELLSGRHMGVFVCIFVVGTRVGGSVELCEFNNKGKKVTAHYYKVPFTQKHVFDIWAAWDDC